MASKYKMQKNNKNIK